MDPFAKKLHTRRAAGLKGRILYLLFFALMVLLLLPLMVAACKGTAFIGTHLLGPILRSFVQNGWRVIFDYHHSDITRISTDAVSAWWGS